MKRERMLVYPVDSQVAVRAGQLLGAVRSGSELSIDAFVVAAAEVLGGALIATLDVRDMQRLAAHAQAVRVASIQP